MKASAIHLWASPGERRLALTGPGGLEHYQIWRPGQRFQPGELHQARVAAIVPAMAGRFVTLDGAEAFLPDTETEGAPGIGAWLTVRILRAPQGGKGPRVTARVPQQPIDRLGLLEPAPGPLAELAALHPGAPIQVASHALLAQFAAAYPGRLTRADPDPDLLDETEALETPETTLPGGLRATITPTPALTAIDLDMAAATAGRAPKPAAQFAANRAALPALARQIRLRNLSGAILIDFAGLPARRRSALGPDLDAALAADPLRPRLLGFTRLGLAEIVRPRRYPPLHELLAGPHAAALAALREATRRAPAALTLRAAPAVIAALDGDPLAREEAAHHTGSLTLRADPTLGACTWMLETPVAG